MKSAIITGATGTIGIALIEKLISENIKVLVLARESGRTNNIPKSPLVTIKYCSLEELNSFQNDKSEEYDVFFHFAWAGTFGVSRNDAEIQEKNIKYTLDAVHLAKRLNCKAFIGAGSQAENGILPFGEKVSQCSQTNPKTGYGIAKLAAGNLSRMLCKELGIRHEWCRVLSVYGPFDSDRSMVMSAINSFLKNDDCNFTKAEQEWDYIYSGDVANAFFLVAENGKDGKTYPIGSGTSKSLKDYILTIKEVSKSNSKCNFGAIDYYDNQVMYLVADISSLEEDTGFTPKTSFKEGIEKTIKSIKRSSNEKN